MTGEGDTVERVQRAFDEYVERFREGPVDRASFLREHPEELREELDVMIGDFLLLREKLGGGGAPLRKGRILGDYRLLAELGRGGMASVWEAEEIDLGRRVALKLLAPHLVLSSVALERFEREARAGGRLTHPGIVQTYRAGEVEGIPFIAQELVPGGYTLADSLADLREERELPRGYYRGTAELFAKLANALEHAHRAGVIHRDVKPANILITPGNEPRLTDFGMARIVDELSRSRTGEVSGTPYYMSPEQAAGRIMGLDHRTDVFSLGATLYEALTLERAFGGDTSQQVFRHILTVDPRPPRQVRSRVPVELEVICMKALEKDRERRYGTMQEFEDDLRRFLEGRPIVARPPGPLARSLKWVRRHRTVSATLATMTAASVLIALLLADALRSRSETDRARQQAEDALHALRASQGELLRSQEELISLARDTNLVPAYADMFGDRSLELARAYVEAGDPDEASRWLAQAPLTPKHVESLTEDPQLGPLVAGRPEFLEDLAERAEGALRYRRPGRDEGGAAVETEHLVEGARLERQWMIEGQYRCVRVIDGADLLAALRLSGEVDVLDADGHRQTSFLLFKGATVLAPYRRGTEAGWAVAGIGSSTHAIQGAGPDGFRWRTETGGAVNDLAVADLDGDGRQEILASLNASGGVVILEASGAVRASIQGTVTNAWSLTTLDPEGDGSPEIVVTRGLGGLVVHDASGQVVDRWAMGFPIRWVRARAGGAKGLVAVGRTLAGSPSIWIFSSEGSLEGSLPLDDGVKAVLSVEVDPSGRWLVLVSQDYDSGKNRLVVADLDDLRVVSTVDVRAPDVDPAGSEDRPVLTPPALGGRRPPKTDRGAARFAGWGPALGEEGPPMILAATRLGLRSYRLEIGD